MSVRYLKDPSPPTVEATDELLGHIAFAQSQVRGFAEAQLATMSELEVEMGPGVLLGHRHIPVLYAIGTSRADAVLCLGGVQALAAMAFGLIDGLAPVDMLVGAGNAFVAGSGGDLARRALRGPRVDRRDPPRAAGRAVGHVIVDVHAHAMLPAVEALVADDPRAAQWRADEAAFFGLESAGPSREIVQRVAPLMLDLAGRLAKMDAQGVDVQLVSTLPAHYHSWAPAEIVGWRQAESSGQGAGPEVTGGRSA